MLILFFFSCVVFSLPCLFTLPLLDFVVTLI